MSEKLVALFFIAVGLWNALNAKQAVRDHQEFQRYLRPKMRPSTEPDTRLAETLTSVAGASFIAIGVAMMFDILPMRDG